MRRWKQQQQQQQTTNDNDKRQTTNNKQQATNNKQQTTNNKQQTTNNKQQTTRRRRRTTTTTTTSSQLLPYYQPFNQLFKAPVDEFRFPRTCWQLHVLQLPYITHSDRDTLRLRGVCSQLKDTTGRIRGNDFEQVLSGRNWLRWDIADLLWELPYILMIFVIISYA